MVYGLLYPTGCDSFWVTARAGSSLLRSLSEIWFVAHPLDGGENSTRFAMDHRENVAVLKQVVLSFTDFAMGQRENVAILKLISWNYTHIDLWWRESLAVLKLNSCNSTHCAMTYAMLMISE